MVAEAVGCAADLPGDEARGDVEVPRFGDKDAIAASRAAVGISASDYDWGTEAFVADPDGYVWALITLTK